MRWTYKRVKGKTKKLFVRVEVEPFIIPLNSLEDKKCRSHIENNQKDCEQTQFSLLDVVTSLHKVFCATNHNHQTVSILKVGILKLLPSFYELPLFLDLIRLASFAGHNYGREEKLRVLHLFLNYVRKHIRHDKAKIITVCDKFDEKTFIQISRYHILRYMQIDGRKKESFKFYSHAMAMKGINCLTASQDESINIMLYFAFVIRNIEKPLKSSIKSVSTSTNSFPILIDESEEGDLQQVLSINGMYKQTRNNHYYIKRIAHYISACIDTCGMYVSDCHKSYYLCTGLDIIIVRMDTADGIMYEYNVYTLEAVIKDCIMCYKALVDKFDTNEQSLEEDTNH